MIIIFLNKDGTERIFFLWWWHQRKIGWKNNQINVILRHQAINEILNH